MRVWNFVLLWSLMLLAPFSSFSQQALHPYANPDSWQVVSSDNFDVYFTKGNRSAALRTIQYAEHARFDLGILFDYKPSNRQTLFYFNDANELLQSNLDLEQPLRQPGLLNMPEHYAFVVHPGTQAGWYEEIRRTVGTLILKEFAYGRTLGATLQTGILLHSADWYWEGLVEYIADGWTFQDEMWLNSIEKRDLLDLALEGDAQINRVVRKSIWHFITSEYNDQKISEIIYLVNIAHSIESGVISVLGISLNTLTERWREFVKENASAQMAGRMNLTDMDQADLLPEKAGYQVRAFSYNERQDLFAVYLEKEGKQSVWLLDPTTGKYEATGIESGISRSDARYLDFVPALSFSPDGDEIVASVYERQKSWLAYYKINSKKLNQKPLANGIQRVLDISWSNDGDQLAISALKGGKANLYIGKAGTASFEAITADPYDERDPVWSIDDQYIFFSSNRDSIMMDVDEPMWGSYLNDMDLFRYDLAEDTLLRVTNTPTVNERQAFIISGYELGYVSDASGIYNLSKVNIFTHATESLTNLGVGVDQIVATEGKLGLSRPVDGEMNLFYVPGGTLPIDQNPALTILRLDEDAKYFSRKALEEKKARQAEAEEVVIDEPEPVVEKPKVVEKEKDEPVRYYIFDEETDPYDTREKPTRLENRQSERVLTTVFGDEAKPELGEIEVDEAISAPTKFKLDYLGLGLAFNPVARYGLTMQSGFSDVLGNHHIDVLLRPYINVRNNDARLRYTYAKGRIDWFADLSYSARHFRRETFVQSDSLILRFDKIDLKVGGIYPLSSKAAVQVQSGLVSLKRQDQQILRQEPLDDNNFLVQAGAAIWYDNVSETQGYTTKGLRARASFDSYYSFTDNEIAFNRLQLNVQNYVEVYKKIVLATQFQAAFNLPNRFVTYYMGGSADQGVPPPISFERDNGIERSNTIATDINSFSFQEFVAPVRGFVPNSREGTRYMVANAELRIPLSRLANFRLNSKSLYNLELIPFLDVGTVWTEGNPFSDKNPTDTQILTNGPITVRLQTLKSPFLIGFGTGLRTNILNYSLRVDIAWGVDDSRLQSPLLMTSVGRNF